MRRIVTRALLALFVLSMAALLAFGPRPVSHAPLGRVRVQYWEKWTGLEAQQMQEIVDAFNNTVGREKNIWVEMNSMSQIDRKTIISTAAGAPPDVVGMWDAQVLQFASLGALTPLDDYAKRYGLTRQTYKDVYYDGCQQSGTLYALPSTVWCVGMLWNKQVFAERADALRAAGCDPGRAPRTIAELDRYATALDVWDGDGPRKHLMRAGFIPAEPGSFTNLYGFWFGAPYADAGGKNMLLTDPAMTRTYDWMRGYADRLGVDRLAEFRSAFNAGQTSVSDTPQNPFFLGWIAMETQGPWVTAQLEKLVPQGMRWGVPADELKREKDFARVTVGMSEADVHALLGTGRRESDTEHWPAGIKAIRVTFADGRVKSTEAKLLPAVERQKFCQWGAAPFPSADESRPNVTYAGMDVWAIPTTARHKDEAFEFIAFASRQKQIERLSSLHCNLSPLREQSEDYRQTHPNPYVDVYEALAASPNARPVPRVINWPNAVDELTQAAERTNLLQGTTADILQRTQLRAQKSLDAANAAAGRGVTP